MIFFACPGNFRRSGVGPCSGRSIRSRTRNSEFVGKVVKMSSHVRRMLTHAYTRNSQHLDTKKEQNTTNAQKLQLSLSFSREFTVAAEQLRSLPEGVTLIRQPSRA